MVTNLENESVIFGYNKDQLYLECKECGFVCQTTEGIERLAKTLRIHNLQCEIQYEIKSEVKAN